MAVGNINEHVHQADFKFHYNYIAYTIGMSDSEESRTLTEKLIELSLGPSAALSPPLNGFCEVSEVIPSLN